MSKKDEKKTETKTETKTESKKSGPVAKSAFYYGGVHYKKGDDLSKMKKEDLEFVKEKGKVE